MFLASISFAASYHLSREVRAFVRPPLLPQVPQVSWNETVFRLANGLIVVTTQSIGTTLQANLGNVLIADWISLSPDVARSLLVTYILIQAFWPLTVVALIALGFWFRHRSAIAARIVAGVAVGLWTISAVPYFYYFGGEAVSRTQLRSRQETLRVPTTIAGITLPAGTLVTYASNAHDLIESLELQQVASVYGMPLTGLVNFDAGRPDGFVTLARDAQIDEVPCSAGENVQLKRGTLDTCTLSHPARIRGIPCRGEVTLSNDSVGCTLALDDRRFGVTWRSGTGITVAKTEGTFDITSRAPNLYVLGAPLPSRAIVTFEESHLSGINFSINPWHFHGCSLMSIEVRYAAIREPRDSCGLPRDRFGNVVLPAAAFTVH